MCTRAWQVAAGAVAPASTVCSRCADDDDVVIATVERRPRPSSSSSVHRQQVVSFPSVRPVDGGWIGPAARTHTKHTHCSVRSYTRTHLHVPIGRIEEGPFGRPKEERRRRRWFFWRPADSSLLCICLRTSIIIHRKATERAAACTQQKRHKKAVPLLCRARELCNVVHRPVSST